MKQNSVDSLDQKHSQHMQQQVNYEEILLKKKNGQNLYVDILQKVNVNSQ